MIYSHHNIILYPSANLCSALDFILIFIIYSNWYCFQYIMINNRWMAELKVVLKNSIDCNIYWKSVSKLICHLGAQTTQNPVSGWKPPIYHFCILDIFCTRHRQDETRHVRVCPGHALHAILILCFGLTWCTVSVTTRQSMGSRLIAWRR